MLCCWQTLWETRTYIVHSSCREGKEAEAIFQAQEISSFNKKEKNCTNYLQKLKKIMYKIKHNIIYSAGFQKQQKLLLGWSRNKQGRFHKRRSNDTAQGHWDSDSQGGTAFSSPSITGSTLSPPSISDNSAFSFLHPLPLDPVREMPRKWRQFHFLPCNNLESFSTWSTWQMNW